LCRIDYPEIIAILNVNACRNLIWDLSPGENVAARTDHQIHDRDVLTAQSTRFYSHHEEARATGHLHVRHRDLLEIIMPNDLRELGQVTLGIVELGARNRDGIATQQFLVKVRESYRHAIRRQQEAGTSKHRRRRR
jgi:hypothetical protein